MSRIATGFLIVAAVLAFNAGMLRDAFAEDLAMRVKLEAAPRVESCATEPRATRVMALLLCLEALKSATQAATPKV